MLKLVTEPNIILHTKSSDIVLVDIKSGKFNTLINDMKQAMIKYAGIGLAAPQIGKNIRLIIVAMTPDNQEGVDARAFFNPVITFKSKEEKIVPEGCLSVPDQYGFVKRVVKIRVKAIDQDGQTINLKAKGLLAQIFQHEIDHLNGELYIEKMEYE